MISCTMLQNIGISFLNYLNTSGSASSGILVTMGYTQGKGAAHILLHHIGSFLEKSRKKPNNSMSANVKTLRLNCPGLPSHLSVDLKDH